MKFNGFFSINDSAGANQQPHVVIRIHGLIYHAMPVSDVSRYIERVFPDRLNEDGFYNDPKILLAEKIIRYQVALYLTRRTPGMDDSICDGFLQDCEDYIAEYRNTFGEDYPDPNHDVQF